MSTKFQTVKRIVVANHHAVARTDDLAIGIKAGQVSKTYGYVLRGRIQLKNIKIIPAVTRAGIHVLLNADELPVHCYLLAIVRQRHRMTARQ
jgi:hypothetical protein